MRTIIDRSDLRSISKGSSQQIIHTDDSHYRNNAKVPYRMRTPRCGSHRSQVQRPEVGKNLWFQERISRYVPPHARRARPPGIARNPEVLTSSRSGARLWWLGLKIIKIIVVTADPALFICPSGAYTAAVLSYSRRFQTTHTEQTSESSMYRL
jgi:hypothetical protein